MSLLSLEEFERQSVSSNSSSERIYQGESIKQGPVFSLENPNAATLYCQRFSKVKNGAVCIIVREKSFLRVWSQANTSKQTNKKAFPLNAKTEISLDDMRVDSSFSEACRQKLAVLIGPIADIICKKTLAKKPNMSRKELVGILAKKIPDSNQALEFKQELLNSIGI